MRKSESLGWFIFFDFANQNRKGFLLASHLAWFWYKQRTEMQYNTLQINFHFDLDSLFVFLLLRMLQTMRFGALILI